MKLPEMPIALLDANVLYPAPLRDFLLHLANLALYRPKWTNEIHNEWIRNLLLNRKDLTVAQLTKAKDAMNGAFPDANVSFHNKLLAELNLPDKNGNHVLAAAIAAKPNTIVTFNLRDFPVSYLQRYDVTPIHPDVFISSLITLT